MLKNVTQNPKGSAELWEPNTAFQTLPSLLPDREQRERELNLYWCCQLHCSDDDRPATLSLRVGKFIGMCSRT